MTFENKNIAFLYFALPPELEAKHKKWSSSKKVNLKIAQKLYESNLKILRKTGIKVFHAEQQKAGDSFGEKLDHAIRTVFSANYQHVIVVGSDCLDFKLSFVHQVCNDLSTGIQSVGKTKDGGVYLFTVSKSQYNPEKIKSIEWCTPRVYAQLLDRIYNDRPLCLPEGHDLDTLDDLLTIVGLGCNQLVIQLKSLFSLNPHSRIIACYQSLWSHLVLRRRGPPLIG